MINACLGPNCLHTVHAAEGISLVAPQLNYIIDIIFELKSKLAKINTEVKELKNQLSVIHLSLVNDVRHVVKATSSSSTSF